MDTATMLEQAMRYVDSYRDVLQSQNPDDWKLEKVEAFIADVRDEMLRREYAPAAANELDTLRAENARLAALVREAASYAWSVIDSYNDYPVYARPEWLEDWRKLLGKLGETVEESEETE